MRVRAYDDADQDDSIANSAIIFEAGQDETLNLTVGNVVYRGPSEYERIVAALKPRLRGLKIAELREDDEYQDVAYLSRDSGEDPRLIALAAAAQRLQARTDIPAEIFYGFFRSDLPVNLPALLVQDPAVLRDAVQLAADDNIIPAWCVEQCDDALAQFKELVVREAVRPRDPEEGPGPLVALLDTALPEAGRQEAFLRRYVAHTGPIREFWEELRGSSDFKDDVDGLQFTFQAGALTGNHLPLIQELQRMRTNGNDKEKITSVQELVRYDEAGWRNILGRSDDGVPIGAPPGVPGEDESKLDNYARVLARRIERSYPTAFVEARLQNDDLDEKENLLRFFQRNLNPGDNQKAFDITGARLESYLDANPTALDDINESDRDALKQQLRAMQRVYRVAPQYEAMSTLLKDGIDSAYAITRMGRTLFTLKYGKEQALGDAMTAGRVFRRAEAIHHKTQALLHQFSALHKTIQLDGLDDAFPTTIEGIPDWQTLFGSLELCECEHCRSVLSPAAYLVDVLHFLQDRSLIHLNSLAYDEFGSLDPDSVVFLAKPDGSSYSAKDVLFARRADLGTIELTCENTQTRLPYVDLVNEILEDFVAPPSQFTAFDLDSSVAGDLDARNVSDPLRAAFSAQSLSLSSFATIQVLKEREQWRVHDFDFTYTIRMIADDSGSNTLQVTTRSRQTNGSEEELAGNPQYVNPAAYKRLKKEPVYPLTLPFDLWHAEAGTYLENMEVPRHQIMETFLPGSRAERLANPDIGRERLGLTLAEAKLITGETIRQEQAEEPGVWNLWGFPKEELGDDGTDASDADSEPAEESLDATNAIPDPACSTGWIASATVPDPENTNNWIESHKWLDVLTGRVDVFLQQSGLKAKESEEAYKRMLDLLGCYYVNPSINGDTRLITVQARPGQPEDTCATEQLRIDGMGEKQALRAMCFLRLWHKLDWNMRDLDRALTVLDADAIDDTLSEKTSEETASEPTADEGTSPEMESSIETESAPSGEAETQTTEDDAASPTATGLFTELLTKISHIQRLHDLLGLPVEKLLPFWGPIDTARYTNHDASGQPPYPSLYEQLFRSKVVVSPPDPAFTEDPTALTGTLSEHVDTITVALGISTADLALLWADAHVLPHATDTLSLLNLSRLYRHATLAKSLRFPIREYLVALTLYGRDPFADPAATVLFVERVNALRAGGLTLTELDYLARHEIIETARVAPTDEEIALVLANLRAELQRIAAENTFVEDVDAPGGPTVDPDGDLTGQKLALLGWDSALIEQVIATSNDAVTYRADLGALPAEITSVSQLNEIGTIEAPLAALPEGLVLPVELSNVVTYDATGQNLSVSRLLTPMERNSLLAASDSADQAFQNALQSIFDRQDERHEEVRGEISYDGDRGELRFEGAMTETRMAWLWSVSEDQTYRDAIDNLFSQPRSFVRRHMRSYTIETFHGLLPALPSITFPNSLQQRISYDAEAGELYFIGAMSEDERGMLSNLSADTAYQEAINTLYAIGQQAPPPADPFSVPLAELPLITWPATLRERIYHDSEAGELYFIGAMSEAEREALRSLSNNTDYQTVINTLYDAADTPSVPLAELPVITWPAALRDRIYHDSEASELYFIGAMSEAERGTLLDLSDESAYQEAINALYDASQQSPPATNIFLTGGGAGNDVATLFDTPTTPAERFVHVLRKLLPYLIDLLSQRTIVQLLADDLDMETPTVRNLLQVWLERRGDPEQALLAVFRDPDFVESHPDLPVTRRLFEEQFDAYLLLHKIALIVERFDCTTRQVGWLFKYATSARWPNLKALPIIERTQAAEPLEAWLRLIELFAVRDRLAQGEDTLDDLLGRADEALQAEESSDSAARNDRKAGYVEALRRWTEWAEDDLETLLVQVDDQTETGLLQATFPADYAGARLLARLQACFALLRRLGLSAAQCADLSASDVTQTTSEMVKRAVRSKYDEAQWLELARPLRDALREQQRSALVAYLLANPTTTYAWRDSNDVYGHFLIDVEMAPCMMTSRIRQAMSSVQLFVQRCQMGLEPLVLASAEIDDRWREWRWMKNYRVWEANRKIFLYPENWIEPELRDDKSPFFEELESALLQDDVTHETAETAFRAYLDSLDEVARLEVVGMYHQAKRDERGEKAFGVLHVFGRTPGTPHIYFYRRWVKKPYEHWTAWERVDLDIEGDHLISVVWLERLFLIWPIFTEEAKPLQPELRLGQPLAATPSKRWKIQLARSEYKNGQWLPKRVSDPSLELEWQDELTPKPDFYFRAVGGSAPHLEVRCYRQDESLVWVATDLEVVSPSTEYTPIYSRSPAVRTIFEDVHLGRFALSGCHSDFRIDNVRSETAQSNLPHGFRRDFMTMGAVSEEWNTLFLPKSDDDDALALRNTEGGYRLLLPHQYNGFGSLQKCHWFFNDEARTYLVVPGPREDYRPEREPPDWGIPEPEAVDPNMIPSFDTPFDLDLDDPFGLIERLEMLGIGPGVVINPGDPLPFEATFPEPDSPVDQGSGGLPTTPFAQETLPADLDMSAMPALMGTTPQAALPLAATDLTLTDSLSSRRAPDQARLTILSALPQARDYLREVERQQIYTVQERYDYLYTFRAFYHPLVCKLIEALNMNGIDGLLNRPQQLRSDAGRVFDDTYQPVKGRQRLVDTNYPVEDVDFSLAGPYSQYNWELFFHAPLLIANSLRQNQRFEDAQRWFHYIFDPTDSSSLPSPQRYWRTKPFFLRGDAEYQRQHITTIMRMLASGGRLDEFVNELLDDINTLVTDTDQWTYVRELLANRNLLYDIVDGFTNLTNEQRATMRSALINGGPLGDILAVLNTDEQQQLEDALRQNLWEALNLEYDELVISVSAWRADPFKPHLVARMRTVAYQKTVVMKYIDNLIAWGDQLFRRDTMESLNEATQLYILAADILGKRPNEIPPRAVPVVHTYDTIEPLLGEFSTALVQIEEFVSPAAAAETAGQSQNGQLTLPGMLYFCIPKNDNLLSYWDTVADRLFKLRHCMNIEGVVRQLPLFAPPIDPALLVRAAAAGVDISSVLNEVSAALPHYRFNVLAQKATELCSELKSLSAALLAALEKKDAEKLALMRAEHETALLKLVEQVREQQVEEAEQQLTALRASREIAVTRYMHYQRLLGIQDVQAPAEGEPIPELSPFEEVAIEEQGGVKIIAREKRELTQLKRADTSQNRASYSEITASIVGLIPQFKSSPYGVGIENGGLALSAVASAVASRFRADSASHSYRGTRASTMARHVMRQHDWVLQSNSAAKEIMNIDRQIVAAELRNAIADQELQNHRKQIEQAQSVEETMRAKFTDQALYNWMVGQISTVYFQAYQLAYDVAKRAERAFRHELGLTDSNYIQFGYWDSLKKGLLAGDRLHHDLKRMEVAYLDQHKREYEISKDVSLLQLDPVALVQLKQTGECFVELPEVLFDLDHPGHYMRRIKSVGLTIPCVTGPYTSVNCTLSLVRSSIRNQSRLLNGNRYARDEQNDDSRFADSLGTTQSIVTSSGQNDSGLFETNLRDERFLPFEGAGAVSTWRIELPHEFRQFDYDTIADVILHVRYTAREGGGLLKQQATLELQTALNEFIRSAGQQGPAQLFSMRHEFPTGWHRFLTAADANGDHVQAFSLAKDRFPFLFQGRTLAITGVDLFGVPRPDTEVPQLVLELTAPGGQVAPLQDGAALGQLVHKTAAVKVDVEHAEDNKADWVFRVRQANVPASLDRLEDILVLCHYTVA